MARPSKAHPFTIFEDAGIPTPESEYGRNLGDNDASSEGHVAADDHAPDAGDWEEEIGIVEGAQDGGDDDESELEDRRQSAVTRTSVSSLPESTYQTEKPYTPPLIRPSFMRPESVRRMQMTSPPPYRSPRQSVLRNSRSRTGTPQSVRSAQARGSPRPRRHISEESEQLDESKHYPLVLLHITLLPITFPWGADSIQELLPHSVLENLQLLKSKVSAIVEQRGLLIPHPREEYELLEERLLEALELKPERITKCGHFRNNRDSIDSTSSAEASDSGLGSSVESFTDGAPCKTCHHHVHTAQSRAGTGSRQWSIKVYAANGLMRAPAWAAAWSEMESVDVEILPWIDDETRKLLDARLEREMAEHRITLEEEAARMPATFSDMDEDFSDSRRVVGTRASAVEPGPMSTPSRGSHHKHMGSLPGDEPDSSAPTPANHELASADAPSDRKPVASDLPQVYKPSQIPLSVLLRNYVFLLAQDRRNVAIFFLASIALWFGMRGGGSTSSALTPAVRMESTHDGNTTVLPYAQVDATTEAVGPVQTDVGDDDSGSLFAQLGIEAGGETKQSGPAQVETERVSAEPAPDVEQVLDEVADMLNEAA